MVIFPYPLHVDINCAEILVNGPVVPFSQTKIMEAELRTQCNELFERIVHLRDCL